MTDTRKIDTYTGIRFEFADPTPEDIRGRDIANGLAYTCRFVGQGTEFYSVARHSLNVARHLEATGASPAVQAYGLLHDASEAYLGDVPGTLKPQLTEYKSVERRVMEAVWEWAGLGTPTDRHRQRVRAVDKAVFEHEAAEFLPAYDSEPDPAIEPTLYGSDEFDAVREEFLQELRSVLGDTTGGRPERLDGESVG